MPTRKRATKACREPSCWSPECRTRRSCTCACKPPTRRLDECPRSRVPCSMTKVWPCYRTGSLQRPCARELTRQRVTWKAAAGVQLELEQALLDGWVFTHQAFDLLGTGIEHPDARHVAAVANRAHDRKEPFGAEREVSSSVLPHDLVGTRLVEPRPRPQNDQTIGLRFREHVTHEFVGDGFHRSLSFASS